MGHAKPAFEDHRSSRVSDEMANIEGMIQDAFGGNEQEFAEAAKKYLDSTDTVILEIRKALLARNTAAFLLVAHRIRGILLGFGQNTMTEPLKGMLDSARGGLCPSRETLEPWIADFHRFNRLLKNYLTQKSLR